MSSYIGAIEVTSGEQALIGSTLYGICNTNADEAAKRVVLSSFDALLQGITVHIKFVKGNTVNSNMTLQFFPDDNINSAALLNISPISVSGSCICETNGVIAFTYELDATTNNKYWRVNNSIHIGEGTTNGTINVNGQDINIHGLGSAAYTESNIYAPINNPTFTGKVTLPGTPATNLEAATKQYVDSKTAGLEGIGSPMVFRGVLDNVANNIVTNGGTESPIIGGTSLTNKQAGDVVVYGHQEYVWNGTTWQLLGDEGSYLLRTSVKTDTASKVNSFSGGTIPSLTLGGGAIPNNQKLVTAVAINESDGTGTAVAVLDSTDYSIPNVTTAGTPMTAAVANGILTLTPGSSTQLGNAISVTKINSFNAKKLNITDATVEWNAGTIATLGYDDLSVIAPNND